MTPAFDIHTSSDPSIVQLNRELNDDTSMILYVVHSPSCGACSQFAPVWEEFKNKNKHKSLNNLILAKIDVSTLSNVDLKDKDDIMGVPYIALKNGNVVSNYDSIRSADGIEQWVLKHIGMNGGFVKKALKRQKTRQKTRQKKSRKSKLKSKLKSKKITRTKKRTKH